MKVFVMWSGKQSQAVAEGVCSLLEGVVKGPAFFVSSRDMVLGKRWQDALSKRLREAHIGIVCITPGQENSQWMHFEAGAVSKMPDALIYPLLVGVPDISGPLAQYQATDAASKEKMFDLAKSLNNARPPKTAVTEATLRASFEERWPEFEPVVASFVEGSSESG